MIGKFRNTAHNNCICEMAATGPQSSFVFHSSFISLSRRQELYFRHTANALTLGVIF